MKTILKVVPCVVQNFSLLCFYHPTEGNQIPKGTVNKAEPLIAAAIRELEEESGIVHDGKDVESVGKFQIFFDDTECHIWNIFLFPSTGHPKSWSHIATGSLDEEGLKFVYFWQPLLKKAKEFSDPYIRVIEILKDHLKSKTQ